MLGVQTRRGMRLDLALVDPALSSSTPPACTSCTGRSTSTGPPPDPAVCGQATGPAEQGLERNALTYRELHVMGASAPAPGSAARGGVRVITPPAGALR